MFLTSELLKWKVVSVGGNGLVDDDEHRGGADGNGGVGLLLGAGDLVLSRKEQSQTTLKVVPAMLTIAVPSGPGP